MKLRFLIPVALVALATLAACGPEVVRGANDPSIDAHALSTGLDKDDVQRALKATLNHMRTSPIMNEWRTTNPKPTVAVFPFRNSTSEHIDSMLDEMLSETETWLIDANVVDVINHDRQREMMGEVRSQQSQDFDMSRASKLGKQLGVKYFITGKVQGADERTEDMRRVQYVIFMQVVDVETSAIRFQKKTEVTKAVK
jgi:TolB-like protein